MIPRTPVQAGNLPFRALLISLLVFSAAAAAVKGQSVAAPQPVPDTAVPGDKGYGKTVVLDPFVVDTSKDQGYKATNATSGTRLNTAIKDLPMPIDVITSQFMEDTGATDLREALRYSAGIVLQSQGGADGLNNSNPGAFNGPGTSGANDPQGVTRNPNASTFVIRGMVTSSSLRDGFQRQAATDTINIDRIEVVSGPAALLYGIGSFGGIVNAIPKTPQDKAASTYDVQFGNNGFYRATIDLTGPIPALPGNAEFRLTGSWQQNGDYTQLYKNRELFISPVLTFRPFPNTLITIDNEWGTDRQTGDGFNSIRAGEGPALGSQASEYRTPFLNPGNEETIRTFKWSGPDTYHYLPARNHLLSVSQQIVENLNLLVGVQQSHSQVDSREINVAQVAEWDSDGIWNANNPADYAHGVFLGTLLGRSASFPLIGVPTDPSQEYYQPPTNAAVVQYKWSDNSFTDNRTQARVDLNYKLDKWGMKNSFLLGASYLRVRQDSLWHGQPGGIGGAPGVGPLDTVEYNYKAIDDPSYFSYTRQGDGLPSAPMVALTGETDFNWDAGIYAIYQGQFFKDRLTIVAGVRRDRADARTSMIDYTVPSPAWSTASRFGAAGNGSVPTSTSPQAGLSFAVTRELSVFGDYSTGLQPNYGISDGAGVPFAPSKAKSYEGGLKLDLLQGKISGTISAFQIKRSNVPKFIWWAPAPVKNASNYNANLPNVVQISGLNANWYNLNKNQPFMKAVDPTGQGANYGTVNLRTDTPQGEAYMNSLWAYQAQSYLNWTGWSFNSGYNVALSDGSGTALLNSPGSNSNDGADVPVSDQSSGWDAKLVFTPTDVWQIVLSYENLHTKVTSAPVYVDTKYYDPYSIWYMPTYGFGTLWGIPKEQAYGNPQKTSTYKGIDTGVGASLSGNPTNTVDLWNVYSLRHSSLEFLKGWTIGAGGTWVGPVEYVNGQTLDGTLVVAADSSGNLHSVVEYTASQVLLNGMVSYKTAWKKHPVKLQVNFNNILDDQKLYGFIYAPGLSYKADISVSF